MDCDVKGIALLAGLTLATAGCGNPPSGSPSPRNSAGSPAPSAAGSSKELLFAVLEPGGDLTAMRNDAVAIVRLDGTAKSKARFEARQLPKIGNASVLTQPEARVAGGRVYYSDAVGQVRALAADGTSTNVAAFPLTNPQELLSFVVSPDGSEVLATLFSFPPVHSPPPQTPIDPPFGPGDFNLQVLAAKPGQAPNQLAKKTWGQTGPLPRDGALEMVGWSNDAPLATTDTLLGTQQGSLGRRMFGHVAELDKAGRPGPPIGGYSCEAWSVLPDRTVLCDEDGGLRNFSVRAPDGTVRFRLQASGDAQYLDLSLSPDGSRVASLVNGGKAMVSGADGKSVQLPANFQPQGWLNPTTLIGVMQTSSGEGNMALVRLDRPTRADNLGFKGFFVGVVQGS
jgi:hypothetical protein